MHRRHMTSVVLLFFALWAAYPSGVSGAGAIKDSESATHGDDAASYQVVETYGFPGFKIVQFNLGVLSHYSYMLISDNQALVIDPGRDVFTYIEQAKKEGAVVKGVFLTHSHADFVAGHIELAKRASCPIYKNASGGAPYAKALKEGDSLEVGGALVRFLETPGHTPDGLCGLVYSKQDQKTVQAIFTGDTLFVGSVGRPDLLEGTMSAAALASMSFDTWINKLSKVNDSAVVLPAHGAGSLCGAHLSDSPSSTIGAERTSNHYLKYTSRAEFIAAVLDGLPEAPQYFKHNAALNRKGPELVEWEAPLPQEAVPDKDLMDPSKSYVVDIRDAETYAAAHIPNSINIGVRGRFESWVGTMVPWGEKLVLCGETQQLKEALYRLHRVGYDGARVITMEKWAKSGMWVATSKMIKPEELYALMKKGEAPVIVDVRLPSEWMGMRIGTVVNLPLTHLHELASKLDPGYPAVTVCNSAYRSSMAVGILQRKGFKHVSSLAGGSEAWIKAGLPVVGPETKTVSAASQPTAPRRDIRLPERIDPPGLKRLVLDLPGTFELVDIRPPDQFADFSIPGSVNVDVADILSNPAYLTGVGPLIIVDRDGSLAMAVAGILSQKTQRLLKVLHGGLEAYWAESELKKAVREVPLGSGTTGGPSHRGIPAERIDSAKPPVSPAPSPAVPPKPSSPKSKSAGC